MNDGNDCWLICCLSLSLLLLFCGRVLGVGIKVEVQGAFEDDIWFVFGCKQARLGENTGQMHNQYSVSNIQDYLKPRGNPSMITVPLKVQRTVPRSDADIEFSFCSCIGMGRFESVEYHLDLIIPEKSGRTNEVKMVEKRTLNQVFPSGCSNLYVESCSGGGGLEYYKVILIMKSFHDVREAESNRKRNVLNK